MGIGRWRHGRTPSFSSARTALATARSRWAAHRAFGTSAWKTPRCFGDGRLVATCCDGRMTRLSSFCAAACLGKFCKVPVAHPREQEADGMEVVLFAFFHGRHLAEVKRRQGLRAVQ